MIECLMVMTIASILLFIAVPSYKGYAGDNILRNNINYLSAAIQYTRSQAIRLKKDVSICASSDQVNCSNSNVWESGWLVSYRDDSDAQIILRVQDSLQSGSLRSDGLTNGGLLTFMRSGSIIQSQQGGTFVSCDERGLQDARALIINNIGFVHIAYDQDGNDIHNDHTGNDVTCPS